MNFRNNSLDMRNIILLLTLFITLCPSQSWAKDPFDEAEEVEIDQEIANNPALQNFLYPDEQPDARRTKKKWEKFKSLEEQGVTYIPQSEQDKPEELPAIPSEYSSDPFANRLDYIKEALDPRPKNY